MNMLKLKRENVNEELEKDMTPILIEDLGMRYATERSPKRVRYGLYECQYCGNHWSAPVSNIKATKTKSCGCRTILRNKERSTTHGLSKHPLYYTWKGMKARCYNKKDKGYKEYGGRGITVCEEWLDVKNFIEDMYPTYKEGLSLDRINTSGNYEPNNCRWANANTQMQNTRSIISRNNSGFRGVSSKHNGTKWHSRICVNSKQIHLGYYDTALEAAKAYEIYVRLNNLEHNFTPALTEDEIEEINKQKEGKC